jgi:hypothetical protein
MKNLTTFFITTFLVVIGAIDFGGSSLMLIDIADGRHNHQAISPYFKANTDNAAMLLALIICAGSLLMIYCGCARIKSLTNKNK